MRTLHGQASQLRSSGARPGPTGRRASWRLKAWLGGLRPRYADGSHTPTQPPRRSAADRPASRRAFSVAAQLPGSTASAECGRLFVGHPHRFPRALAMGRGFPLALAGCIARGRTVRTENPCHIFKNLLTLYHSILVSLRAACAAASMTSISSSLSLRVMDCSRMS